MRSNSVTAARLQHRGTDVINRARSRASPAPCCIWRSTPLVRPRPYQWTQHRLGVTSDCCVPTYAGPLVTDAETGIDLQAGSGASSARRTRAPDACKQQRTHHCWSACRKHSAASEELRGSAPLIENTYVSCFSFATRRRILCRCRLCLSCQHCHDLRRPSPYEAAAREVVQLVQSGEADRQRVGELTDVLLDAQVPFR